MLDTALRGALSVCTGRQRETSDRCSFWTLHEIQMRTDSSGICTGVVTVCRNRWPANKCRRVLSESSYLAALGEDSNKTDIYRGRMHEILKLAWEWRKWTSSGRMVPGSNCQLGAPTHPSLFLTPDNQPTTARQSGSPFSYFTCLHVHHC